MKKKFRFPLKLKYNAPVTITFFLICAAILICNNIFKDLNITEKFFSVPGSSKSLVPFDWHSPLDYIRLFTHVFGHSDFSHLIANFSFILLLGPLLEERYGSAILALMMSVTALVTGVLTACLIPTPLMGSSGIAFMMILLASFTSFAKHEVPLSFILILVLYLGKEVFIPGKATNIATYAHIAGGLCGSMFGFLTAPKTRKTKEARLKEIDESSPRNNTFNSNSKKNADNDETVIGSINI